MLFNVWTGLLAFLSYVLVAIAMWLVFKKAGRPGILALIPMVHIGAPGQLRGAPERVPLCCARREPEGRAA